MKTSIYSAFIMVLLASCAGYQMVSFYPDGSMKSVIQSDATAAKGERSMRAISDARGVKIQSVQENYDSTEVPKAYLDTKLGIAVSDNARISNNVTEQQKTAREANARPPIVTTPSVGPNGEILTPVVTQPTPAIVPSVKAKR